MLKPLYINFENDFIDFWRLLNVDFGESSSSITKKYKKILNKNKGVENLDEYYVGYKLLRDKNFEKVYFDTKSLKKTYDAGFFLDSMSVDDYDHIKKINYPIIPLNKLSFNENKKNIVLISTGGFSPIHEGHLHTLEIAKSELEKIGYHVSGGYISPSHDHYVSSKDKGKAHNPALNRIKLCNEAIINSNWLMTSALESVYTKTSINYTDAIADIKTQLFNNFNKNIIIGYVFGGDNAPFIRAFQSEDLAICISRNNERESIIKEKNIKHLNYIYIKENPFKDLSSTKIRNSKIKRDESKSEKSDLYLIRDDFNYYNEISNNYSPIKKFEKIIKRYLPKLNIVSIDVEEQIKKAKKDLLKIKYNSISLDVYLKGNINIEISRVFNLCDSQIKAVDFVSRPESKKEKLEHSVFKEKKYVLIEDDIASGQTLNYLKSILPLNTEIDDYILLSNYSKFKNEKHFDIVDLRDFIINAPFGGLVTKSQEKIFRVPYIAPFVDLTTRASIPPEKAILFSIDVLELNKSFYNELKEKNIEIKLNEELKTFFNYINYKYEKMKGVDAIIEYCNQQIKFLKGTIYE